jgi:hypothetical protein
MEESMSNIDMSDEKKKYNELEKQAAYEAQRGNFKKAIELENRATEIVKNYRGKG